MIAGGSVTNSHVPQGIFDITSQTENLPEYQFQSEVSTGCYSTYSIATDTLQVSAHMILERLHVLSRVLLQLHGPCWVKLEENVPKFH
jgi:hypothetical protein